MNFHKTECKHKTGNIIIFVGIQNPSFPWQVSQRQITCIEHWKLTCDQQCSTTDGSRKDFAHHGAILNIQAFNLPHLFYLYVHEIIVLYIWYSIHVHWHQNMLLFRLFPVTKDPVAAQYPKQCVLCLPVTARTICTAGLGAYF